MTDDAGISDVNVQLMVYDLIEVDITKHQFTIEFLLEVSWQVLLDAGASWGTRHAARTQRVNMQRCQR